jgi:hypothetical protein
MAYPFFARAHMKLATATKMVKEVMNCMVKDACDDNELLRLVLFGRGYLRIKLSDFKITFIT